MRMQVAAANDVMSADFPLCGKKSIDYLNSRSQNEKLVLYM